MKIHFLFTFRCENRSCHFHALLTYILVRNAGGFLVSCTSAFFRTTIPSKSQVKTSHFLKSQKYEALKSVFSFCASWKAKEKDAVPKDCAIFNTLEHCHLRRGRGVVLRLLRLRSRIAVFSPLYGACIPCGKPRLIVNLCHQHKVHQIIVADSVPTL